MTKTDTQRAAPTPSAEGVRRRYAPPRVETRPLFERMALNCDPNPITEEKDTQT